jgi:hypothetical protein
LGFKNADTTGVAMAASMKIRNSLMIWFYWAGISNLSAHMADRLGTANVAAGFAAPQTGSIWLSLVGLGLLLGAAWEKIKR